MRRLSGVLLAAAILLLPAFAQPARAQNQKLTFEGEQVIWMVSIKAGKEADFEAVVAALKSALAQSTDPMAKTQAAGWKILKATKPQPDGTTIYTHYITVVPGADYGVMANIYTAVKDPTEQRALYDKYAGAFDKNILQLSFTTTADLGAP
jgi:hypothetical protein